MIAQKKMSNRSNITVESEQNIYLDKPSLSQKKFIWEKQAEIFLLIIIERRALIKHYNKKLSTKQYNTKLQLWYE